MAVEIRITRELNDFAPKLIGPLTGRQCLCILCAALPCYFMYTQLRKYMPIDVVGFFCIIPAAIAVAFGWIRPYGMKMEVYLRSVFVTTVLAPSKRKYRNPNRSEQLFAKIESAELAAIEKENEVGIKQKKKKKPVEQAEKYKRSPLAYD